MILLYLVLGAAAVSLVTAAVGQTRGPKAGWVAAGGFAALTVMLAAQGVHARPELTVPWLPSLDIALRLRLDGLGLLFGLIVLGVGSLVMGYAASYLPKGRHGLFYALLTFFAVAMLLLVFANDIVLLWIAWEFTTLCSFLLIAQTGPKGKGPAIRTLIVTGAGGLSLLAAVCLMWATTGTTVLSDVIASSAWQANPGRLATVAVLVALAAFTKAAQFPFHAWLPDAMVASTPVSSYLHAAAMVKAGIFLLLRFSGLFHGVVIWHVLLLSIGLFTAVMGAVFALQRFDLKELLAYSTISQLGFLVATIGVGTKYALAGALVHVLAHALFKSALFMSVGLIDHEAGTRDLRKLSGLRHSMPVTSVLLVVSAASMAGLPPLFGFVSKEAMFKGLTTVADVLPGGLTLRWVVVVVAVVAASLTFAYCARMVLTTVGGPNLPKPPHEAPAAMWAPVSVAAGAGVVFGVAGMLVAPLLASAAAAITGSWNRPDLSLWHGFNLPLMMSITVIGLGVVLVLARQTISRALDRPLWPVRAVNVVEGFRNGSIKLGATVGKATADDAPYRHLLVPLLGFGLVAGGVALAVRPTWTPPGSFASDWLFAGLVLLGVGLSLRARSRVALVTTVGIVGFTVALMFFGLGAPDVALTQLLVETLTVVMMVMLLVRLPANFHHTDNRRSWTAGVVALVVAGTGFLTALLVLDAGSHPAPLGTWFVEHAKELTGGYNVVNTILVDFRALDTLGELTALGVAGIALVVALESRALLPLAKSPIVVDQSSPIRSSRDNSLALRVTDRFVGPLLLIMSIWFYLRGHYQPGGGFIAALIASAAIALIYLSASDDSVSRLRLPALGLIGSGVAIATATGLLGLTQGAFLRPLYATIFGVKLSSTLVFDLGVFLAVLGLVLAAVSRLGIQDTDASAPVRKRGDVTVKGGQH